MPIALLRTLVAIADFTKAGSALDLTRSAISAPGGRLQSGPVRDQVQCNGI